MFTDLYKATLTEFIKKNAGLSRKEQALYLKQVLYDKVASFALKIMNQ